ncbi:hypothetical protein PUN4_720028 [Paraburkholderia unamae]|nr:hypothetical protein PUN4_720028 [Paraburkholderia unamae]
MPGRVSARLRVSRVNSEVPSICSSRLICMLTAACERCTATAAFVKLPASATAAKVRSKSISNSGFMQGSGLISWIDGILQFNSFADTLQLANTDWVFNLLSTFPLRPCKPTSPAAASKACSCSPAVAS